MPGGANTMMYHQSLHDTIPLRGVVSVEEPYVDVTDVAPPEHAVIGSPLAWAAAGAA